MRWALLGVMFSGVGVRIGFYGLLVTDVNNLYSGGYCGGVPPLPIPNREVKPACADGTAMQCGRVGGRHFSVMKPWLSDESGLLSFSLPLIP